MIVEVSEIKALMGLDPAPDATIDPKIENSILQAQTAVESYIGMAIEAHEVEDEQINKPQGNPIRLSEYPVIEIAEISRDGQTLDEATYRLSKKSGQVYEQGCPCFSTCCNTSVVLVTYTAGWDEDHVPADLKLAVSNMAIGIYNDGGNLGTSAGGTGELKSLTMFDAMSMSFDVGGSSSSSSGVKGMIEQWSYVLNRYKIDDPVFA